MAKVNGVAIVAFNDTKTAEFRSNKNQEPNESFLRRKDLLIKSSKPCILTIYLVQPLPLQKSLERIHLETQLTARSTMRA